MKPLQTVTIEEASEIEDEPITRQQQAGQNDNEG
jgi:hypothetical protein